MRERAKPAASPPGPAAPRVPEAASDAAGVPPTKQIRILVEFPQAEEVGVAGDFNQWNPEGTPLHHGAQGLWYATLDLAPGTYEYRLRVDGEWRDDPHARKRVPNPFGTENCVLIVD